MKIKIERKRKLDSFFKGKLTLKHFKLLDHSKTNSVDKISALPTHLIKLKVRVKVLRTTLRNEHAVGASILGDLICWLKPYPRHYFLVPS